jgi:hypothetical protein
MSSSKQQETYIQDEMDSNSGDIKDEVKNKKVLYVPGFEGRERDKRFRLISSIFANTVSSELKLRESLSRGKFYVSIGSIASIGTIGYISYILGIKKNRLYSMFLFILGSGTVLSFLIRWAMRRVWKNALNNSVDIERNDIKKHKPDLIIASTYGAAVMAEVIRTQKYLYRNPLLLLTPAQDEVARRTGQSAKNIIIPDTIPNVVIIHGKNDRYIPYQDSVNYVERSKSVNPNVKLKLIDGEDHSLSKTITAENLKKLVSDFFLN